MIEDNKLVLKAKYAEAKELGEAVNVSRNRMSTPPPGHTHAQARAHLHTPGRALAPLPTGLSLPTIPCAALLTAVVHPRWTRGTRRRLPLTEARSRRIEASSPSRHRMRVMGSTREEPRRCDAVSTPTGPLKRLAVPWQTS